MNKQHNATFYIFKKSGKYYTHARGNTVTCDNFIDHISSRTSTREEVLKANKGKMPGLIDDGYEYVVTIIPDEDIDSIKYVCWPLHLT